MHDGQNLGFFRQTCSNDTVLKAVFFRKEQRDRHRLWGMNFMLKPVLHGHAGDGILKTKNTYFLTNSTHTHINCQSTPTPLLLGSAPFPTRFYNCGNGQGCKVIDV